MSYQFLSILILMIEFLLKSWFAWVQIVSNSICRPVQVLWVLIRSRYYQTTHANKIWSTLPKKFPLRACTWFHLQFSFYVGIINLFSFFPCNRGYFSFFHRKLENIFHKNNNKSLYLVTFRIFHLYFFFPLHLLHANISAQDGFNVCISLRKSLDYEGI